MKITVEPSGEFEGVENRRCRLWHGTTDKGVPVTLYVAMVRVPTAADNSAFEQELREVKIERQLAYFDNRVLD